MPLRMLLIGLLFLIPFRGQSQHFANYHEPVPGHKLEFDRHEYIDTIWRYRDSTTTPIKKDYSFTATNVGEETVLCGYSRRIRGGDPDYNRKYPNEIKPGETGEFTIWFPGRIFNPPFVLTRKYIANSSAEERDTLVIKRVFAWADRDTIHYRTKIGTEPVSIVEHRPRMKDSILFINVHEDEQTSIEALRIFSKEKPIHYIYLEHSGKRRIGFKNNMDSVTFDPNRMFTDSGRVKTLEQDRKVSDGSKYRLKKFSEKLTWEIDHKTVIIALHNNTDTNYSIQSYLPDSSEAQNTKALYINPEMDQDDFIYTTDQEFYDIMVANKVNVILQDNENFVDDGSMSVYCGMNNIRYINIETEHGHLEKQLELLRLVYAIFHP